VSDEKTQTIREILMLVGGGISGWIITNLRPKQVREDEHDKSQNATLEIQGRTLEGAWTMIEKLQAQIFKQDQKIRELDNEIVKYSRALNRSIKFIAENLPGVDVPDFLKDTDPNIGKKKL